MGNSHHWPRNFLVVVAAVDDVVDAVAAAGDVDVVDAVAAAGDVDVVAADGYIAAVVAVFCYDHVLGDVCTLAACDSNQILKLNRYLESEFLTD